MENHVKLKKLSSPRTTTTAKRSYCSCCHNLKTYGRTRLLVYNCELRTDVTCGKRSPVYSATFHAGLIAGKSAAKRIFKKVHDELTEPAETD